MGFLEQADHPIALVYNELHPQWIKSVESFLRRHGLRSLALTFTGKDQLRYLDSPLKEHLRYLDPPLCRPFTSLTSLSLKLRGTVADKSDNYDYRYKKHKEIEWEEEREKESWTITLDCPALQRLKLGRGKWGLEEGWAEQFKSLRSLTLKHMDWSYVDLDYLATLTPQLSEFVLYHSWDFNRPSSGPGGDETFTFDLSKAQTVRFYFPHSTLTLSLARSSSLTTFTAMGKQLLLSCKSTEPLTLQHLLLYGQQRLVISSLRLASVRVAYLNGPPKDVHPRDDKFSSYLDFPELSLQFLPELSPDRESVHNSTAFSWAEWLRSIAPTVEVLIMRHGVPVEGVDAEWSNLRSLGIVVEREELFEVDLKVEKPIFFPTSTCEERTLSSLREFCPSLAPYCISHRSFYWEKQGRELPETPVVHVRDAKSGVPCACFAEKRPKNVREKMHCVNGELVDGGSSGGSRAFYAPVVTPFEALMALEEGEWTGEYRMLLDGAGVGGKEEEARSGSEFLALRCDYKGLEVLWFMEPGGAPSGMAGKVQSGSGVPSSQGSRNADGRGGGDEGGRGDGGGVGAFMLKVALAIDAVRVVEGKEGRAAGYEDELLQG
ncbi:unnamed protein product [Closterium sp. NIES-65]|nr:unnamed protein product [Closterium sp. NIES-65]